MFRAVCFQAYQLPRVVLHQCKDICSIVVVVVVVNGSFVFLPVSDKYFIPVSCFLLFNLMDWAGRSLTAACMWVSTDTETRAQRSAHEARPLTFWRFGLPLRGQSSTDLFRRLSGTRSLKLLL